MGDNEEFQKFLSCGPEEACNEAACLKWEQAIHWLPRYDVSKRAHYAKNQVFFLNTKLAQNFKNSLKILLKDLPMKQHAIISRNWFNGYGDMMYLR